MTDVNGWGGARSNSGPKKKVVPTKLELEEKQNALVELELGDEDIVTLLVKARDTLEAEQDQTLAGILHKTGMSKKNFFKLVDMAPELLNPSYFALVEKFNSTRQTLNYVDSQLPNASKEKLLALKHMVETVSSSSKKSSGNNPATA